LLAAIAVSEFLTERFTLMPSMLLGMINNVIWYKLVDSFLVNFRKQIKPNLQLAGLHGHTCTVGTLTTTKQTL